MPFNGIILVMLNVDKKYFSFPSISSSHSWLMNDDGVFNVVVVVVVVIGWKIIIKLLSLLFRTFLSTSTTTTTYNHIIFVLCFILLFNLYWPKIIINNYIYL